MSNHKIFDQNRKMIFEGTNEECYEFILKLMSGNSEDYKMKYENYLKSKKEHYEI